jgi:Fur family peroxide stress response transcriptional regulator
VVFKFWVGKISGESREVLSGDSARDFRGFARCMGQVIVDFTSKNNGLKLRDEMDDILNKYREKGFRLTPQRISILNYLKDNTDHPTIEDIFTAVKKVHPTISLATVYNTAQALSDIGELTELTIDAERKHYDPDTSVHHHIVCTECKKIADVFVDYSESLRLPEEILSSFSVTGNHVDFSGLCMGCVD